MSIKIIKSSAAASFLKSARQNASYLFLSSVFLIGLCIGAFCVRLTGYATQVTLLDSFTYLIYIRQDYGILKLLSASLISELFYYVLAFVFGLSVLGVAVCIAIILFKGFCIGFFVGFIASVFGISGVCCLLIAIIPGMLLSFLMLLIFCERALQISYNTIVCNKASGSYERPSVKSFYKKGLALFCLSSLGILYQTLICPSVIKLIIP